MQENKEERIMKQIKLEINIEACHYNELTEKDRKLIDAACEATKRSYAPYSHFAVGAAALLENDIVITGTNQENAQAALLGASKTDWLPSFFLNGSFGYASHDMKDFTRRSSMTWSIAPSMSWTIFNGGQRANNVRLQRAQLDETINQFNTTVLTAVQEVDNAMSSYKNSIKQIVACREMLNQGKEAFKLSLDLYKQGLSPFQNVLDAQRSLLSYENSLVQAQGYSLLCLIQMYQALGGGW